MGWGGCGGVCRGETMGRSWLSSLFTRRIERRLDCWQDVCKQSSDKEHYESLMLNKRDVFKMLAWQLMFATGREVTINISWEIKLVLATQLLFDVPKELCACCSWLFNGGNYNCVLEIKRWIYGEGWRKREGEKWAASYQYGRFTGGSNMYARKKRSVYRQTLKARGCNLCTALPFCIDIWQWVLQAQGTLRQRKDKQYHHPGTFCGRPNKNKSLYAHGRIIIARWRRVAIITPGGPATSQMPALYLRGVRNPTCSPSCFSLPHWFDTITHPPWTVKLWIH